ncbi:unnamed protein product [Cochlearia groenlandica]
MPISYTNSSSSEASFDSGCNRAHGTFGVPLKCWCGQLMKVDGGGDGRDHIRTWWDHAIDEELKKMKTRDEELHNFINTSVSMLWQEISRINGRLSEKDEEIERLRRLLARR